MPAPKDAATRLPNAEKSLPRLLLEVCGQIAALVVPMFFITLLAPEFAVLAVLGSAAAMWLGARLGWLRFARGGSQLMSSAVFGLGFSLGRAVPEYWNIAAAALVIMVGLASVATWERLFGLVSEFDDSWLRAQHPRMGGYLLTATGIGVSNLAPSLIWSVYGRYLALTRLCTDMGSSREGQRGWQLLLVDMPQRSLRCSPRWLHNLPCFEGLSAEGPRLRLQPGLGSHRGNRPRRSTAPADG